MKTLRQLGEFGIIQKIRRGIKKSPRVIRGIGDDAAVIVRGNDNSGLATTDALVEGIDFLWDKTPARLVGRKLMAVNLSDIAAMGGIPRHALLTLGLRPDIPVSWIDRFMKGLLEMGEDFKVSLIGGDITKSRQFWASLVLLGDVETGKWILRSGAKPGDAIFVTGYLGGSILGKHLKFTPRIREAREIAWKFHPSSMIDISDGLLKDLGHILDESRAGADIDTSRIPISRESRKLSVEDGMPPIHHALSDGEDFELVFTVSPRDSVTIPSQILGVTVSRIGTITKKRGIRIFESIKNGKLIKIKPQGFTHF